MIPINRTTITLGILIVLLAALGIQTVRASRYRAKMVLAENEREQVISFANATKTEAERYKNELGNVINRTEQLELTIKNVNELKETERLKFLREFSRLKANLKNLEEAGRFDWLIEEDSIPMEVVNVPCTDTLRAFNYRLKDEYNDIEAMVLDTPRVSIRVPIYYAELWDRKWFLGKKRYYMETTSPNKLIRLEAQETFKVSKRKR